MWSSFISFAPAVMRLYKTLCEFSAESQANLRRTARAVSPKTRITILFEEVIPPALSAKCTIRSFPQTCVLPFRRGYISQAKQNCAKLEREERLAAVTVCTVTIKSSGADV